MTPTPRELGPDDVDALQDLLASAPGHSERTTGYAPGPSDALSALIAVPDGFDPAGKHGWGLWDEGVLVAFADVLMGYPTPEHAFVGLIIVRGDRQGSGLGRAMHDVVLERVRAAARIRRLRLGIIATEADVVEPFWRALGYRPTGKEHPYRYDHLESTVALWERAV